MDNYSQLVERIANSSKTTKEDIERRIEAKRAKLSGLVSKEGAAQIVAAELGINFDRERLKISELTMGMKRVNVVAKIVKAFPIVEFNKNGKEGKVARLNIADETSPTKLVLWDTNHIGLIESGSLKEGDTIEISNGSMRNGEIHLSSFSDIKISNEKLKDVSVQRAMAEKKLKDIKVGDNVKFRALIVQTFEPRYFEVCPECGKRANEGQCIVHGKVNPAKRALLNVVLDDGTESIRSVMFGDQINKLGLTNEEIFSLEKFAEKKDGLLGEEKIFTGNVRSNSLYNTIELNIDSIEEIDVSSLIKELETKA